MKPFRYLFLVYLLLSLFACSGNAKLFDKTKTKQAKIKWYAVGTDTTISKIYARVKSNHVLSFYSFFPGKIVKITDTAKVMSYTVFYDNFPEGYDHRTYREFSTLDSIVLAGGDLILDSLGLKKFRKSAGASGFIAEVNWYHGYPEYRKFVAD